MILLKVFLNLQLTQLESDQCASCCSLSKLMLVRGLQTRHYSPILQLQSHQFIPCITHNNVCVIKNIICVIITCSWFIFSSTNKDLRPKSLSSLNYSKYGQVFVRAAFQLKCANFHKDTLSFTPFWKEYYNYIGIVSKEVWPNKPAIIMSKLNAKILMLFSCKKHYVL